MNKTVKKIVIGLLVAFVIYNVYRLVAPKKDPNQAPKVAKNGLVSGVTPETTAKKESIEKLLALLLSVNNIKLSSVIFSTPEFQSLKNFSLSDEEQNLVLDYGRKNPFLPIGDESAGAYVNVEAAAAGGAKTNPVTSSTMSSALLVGENTVGSTLEQYFEWGTTGVAPLGQITPTIAKTASKTYTYTLGNLLPDTVYFYRAVVKTKDNKLIVGEIQSFKTPKN